MSIRHKVVIVTGAGNGIGLAIAKTLNAEGAVVYAGIRKKEDVQKLPKPITPLFVDVQHRSDVIRAVQKVIQEEGKVDVLVNNAGVERVGAVEDMTEGDQNQIVDTNLKGAIYMTSSVIPNMKANTSGHIVFINSLSGLRGYADDAIYCASKHGLAGFADALLEELRPHGVRITSIFPGATDTGFAYESWSPSGDPRRPYFLKPEDIAEAVLFSVSQPARAVVSQIVIQPFIERQYSGFMDPKTVEDLSDHS